ncbi:Mov34/MPN/PAD-1 family protein [Nitrosotalea sinensis]|jgi:proteasome lid subunit RPN8/RPN11|uniref:Mov34/MPN/PAD-1 family protein n=1 Tax=Nitrosotalea sinensis TaxID=1499975 RepID=A0A2H1EH93_9ARCH|nr:M67 family metallopeptidase [Candidatus Nitrosotalea sinensis]SHO46271.1 Mov34/MPN/PAD-1 family protein [Candidatus Nitrosotalea sinensis]
MIKQIAISSSQIKLLAEHSKKNSPNESCAILFGKTENNITTIKDIFFAKNIEESPVNFTISNDELISAYSQAEKKNLDVSGIFHSHPVSEPYPSSTDKKYMEVNDVPWVIFSNIEDKFMAYIYNSGIVQIPLKVS